MRTSTDVGSSQASVPLAQPVLVPVDMSPRLFALCIIIALLLGALLSAAQAEIPASALRTGDVVFQTSRSTQSVAIQKATGSVFSHTGIVEMTPQGAFVIEAIGPVTRTPWSRWVQRGVGGRATVMRLPGLTPAQASAVVRVAHSLLGRPYDAAFQWDDRRIYCSELVEKSFERGAGIRLGTLQRLDSLDLRGLSPALQGRFGAHVPGDRLLITPASIAADSKLIRVAE